MYEIPVRFYHEVIALHENPKMHFFPKEGITKCASHVKFDDFFVGTRHFSDEFPKNYLSLFKISGKQLINPKELIPFYEPIRKVNTMVFCVFSVFFSRLFLACLYQKWCQTGNLARRHCKFFVCRMQPLCYTKTRAKTKKFTVKPMQPNSKFDAVSGITKCVLRKGVKEKTKNLSKIHCVDFVDRFMNHLASHASSTFIWDGMR
jgi:hypothetical protein